MSDWKTVEAFQARSGAQYSAFAVGMAIAGLGNRKDGGWTYASIARIALLARVDPKSAHRAINELVDSGELEYVPGTSRHNPSRYRIRTEILNTGVDRFRCPLTMDKSSMVTMDKLSTVTRDDSSADHGQFDAHPGQIDHATMEYLSTPSVNRSVNRSIDQISDQRDDPTLGWVRTEADDIALKTSFEACRRVADSAGEESTEPDTAVKVTEAVSRLPDDWLPSVDASAARMMSAGKARLELRRNRRGDERGR